MLIRTPALHASLNIPSGVLQGSTNNALCFMGPHRKYNTFSASAYELMPGQGHFGPDAIPGVNATHPNSFPVPSHTLTAQPQLRMRVGGAR